MATAEQQHQESKEPSRSPAAQTEEGGGRVRERPPERGGRAKPFTHRGDMVSLGPAAVRRRRMEPTLAFCSERLSHSPPSAPPPRTLSAGRSNKGSLSASDCRGPGRAETRLLLSLHGPPRSNPALPSDIAALKQTNKLLGSSTLTRSLFKAHSSTCCMQEVEEEQGAEPLEGCNVKISKASRRASRCSNSSKVKFLRLELRDDKDCWLPPNC